MNRRVFLKSSLALAAVAALARAETPGRESFSAAESNNRFALDLFARLRAADGNLFFSPFSIESALAMTAAGARGRTEEEMRRVLHLPATGDQADAFGRLRHQLSAADANRGYRLAIANALWGQKGFGFKPEYVEKVRANYGASLTELDFAADPDTCRATINHWVEQQTQDRIKNLLGPDTVPPSTKLVLTNAIYFKGDWARQFDRRATFDEAFSVAGKPQKVPMMHRTGDYSYAENDLVQVLAAPYKGNELSMIFILPRKKDGLADVEKTAADLPKWLGGLHAAIVMVTLPRFKMTREYKLARTLSEMGMPSAFSGADFSGISDGALVISEVVHKAFVEVNEEGAEAAAATGVVMKTPGPVMHNPVFRADHPFLFLIRDNGSGAILFLGRVANPQ